MNLRKLMLYSLALWLAWQVVTTRVKLDFLYNQLTEVRLCKDGRCFST
jgi:hypothetical protein